MTVKIEIVLTSGVDGVFYPGQEVIGEAIVVLTKTIRVSRLKLTISGIGKTEWSEANSQNGRFLNLEQFLFQANDAASSTTYTGKECYLHSELILCQVNDFMPAGGYTYGFACPLPEAIPASFEGKNGRIRYSLTVTVERPWKQSKAHTLGFQVSRELDLNKVPLLPIKAEHTKFLSCWPCLPSGSLALSVQLPSNGFIPGQMISTLLRINSRRNIKVREITTVLIQKTTYSARWPKHRQRIESVIICKTVSPGITLPEGGILAEENLQVPWLLPTTCCSKIIKICYEIKVALEVNTCYLQDPFAVIAIPIVIGTIAERDSELSEEETVLEWSRKS
ncbi:arrestin domain-containing protein 2-like [Toxorhynchites rutilus septentrionalis]|uniref:arrestin domain-containing protein 2-like n=1 Tax=Toxorhynchites rutilus septentrionalis TaxID=329112 RepID=UPI002479CC00|nr:arrestin domain-containing protein 2-like [Toxorhynchites rutilus septentrionalis]